MGLKVWHTHFSSRFDEGAVGLKRLIDDNRDSKEWFTVTEIDAQIRANALRRDGWGVSLPEKNAGPRDDCGQTWNKDTFVCVHKESRKLSGQRLIRKRGGYSSPLEGNFVVLEAGNHRHLSAVAHLGSGIENDLKDRKANTHNGRVYLKDLRKLVQIAEEIAEDYDCDSITISFDGNLNVRLAWARWLLQIRGFKINWKKPYPKQGTFARRLIDLTLYKGKIRITQGPYLVSADGTSDHQNGFTEQFELLNA